MKAYTFIVIVKNATARHQAERAILIAFANRKPDGCEFHLRKRDPKALALKEEGKL